MLQRIAFISIFRQEHGGGEGRVAHEMARHFASEYAAAMICPGDRTDLDEDESGLKVLTIRSSGEGSVSMPLLSQQNTRRIFDFLDHFQPNIVHAHDPALIGVIGQVWAKMHGVPFVHTAHLLPTKALDFGAREVVRIPANFLTDYVTTEFLANFYLNSDAIIALNQNAMREMRTFGYQSKLFVIPNGRHLQTYRRCRCADTSANEKVLTFIGFINRRKNQSYLLEMFRRLKGSYRLQLIGEALEPVYVKQLNDFIEENGLQGVEFLGAVNHRDIPAYLEKSHALVSASKMEVQSLVVIEALASGTPVIGLSNETMDELVDDRVGCRLPRNAEPAAFAACVERICNLPQPEYERMCQAARARVKHLDWDNVMRQTVEVYCTLLSERPTIPRVDWARLQGIVARVPSERVRSVLMERMAAMAANVSKVNRVSRQTWLMVGITMLGSLIAYLFLRRPFRFRNPFSKGRSQF
jgi:1,2-diacylglycerol 3-alpha-glucosyltransferase